MPNNQVSTPERCGYFHFLSTSSRCQVGASTLARSSGGIWCQRGPMQHGQETGGRGRRLDILQYVRVARADSDAQPQAATHATCAGAKPSRTVRYPPFFKTSVFSASHMMRPRDPPCPPRVFLADQAINRLSPILKSAAHTASHGGAALLSAFEEIPCHCQGRARCSRSCAHRCHSTTAAAGRTSTIEGHAPVQ